VKSLVELHGGNLILRSEPGQGTKVTFRLPENGLRDMSKSHRPALSAREQPGLVANQ